MAQAGPRNGSETARWDICPAQRERSPQARSAAFQMRVDRAATGTTPMQISLANDDELLCGRVGQPWALPHDDLGHPDPEAFAALVHDLRDGGPGTTLPRSAGKGTAPQPQGGLSFEFCGYDSNQTIVPPAPAFASAWRAGEMVEVYWAALLRDVPFTGGTPPGRAGLRDLSRLSDFRGPKDGGLVTPYTIFRAPYTGAVDGPSSRNSCSRTSPSGRSSTRSRCGCSCRGWTT